MGQFIKLPGVTAASSRPKVDLVDPVVPDRGAIALLEPAHPMAPWPSGVPANGGSVPNVVGKLAAPLIGSDTSALGGTSRETDAANLVVVERSTKGGIHAAVSQATTPFPANTFWRLELADAIKQYLQNNLGHSFYLGSVARITRLGRNAGTPFMTSQIVSAGASFLGGIYANQGTGGTQMQTLPASNNQPATFIGSRVDAAYAAETKAPRLNTLGVAGWGGTRPTAISGFSAHAFQAGQTTPIAAGTTALYPSLVFYRFYLEDLTISGRSWAQVDAAEFTNFQRLFAAGGRYAGDTWTDPATLIA